MLKKDKKSAPALIIQTPLPPPEKLNLTIYDGLCLQITATSVRPGLRFRVVVQK